MGKKKKIIALFITVLLLGCVPFKQIPLTTRFSETSAKSQLFWDCFNEESCDSLGWVNPSVFKSYVFTSIDSILTWGECLYLGFIEKKDFCVANNDIIIVQWSLGSGEWRPFFTVFRKKEEKWQLCTAKIFSTDYWNKIKIEHNDDKEVFIFKADDKYVSELHYGIGGDFGTSQATKGRALNDHILD